MSSYIVTAACIHAVVATVLPTGTVAEKTDFGRDLYRLNAEAYAYRYREPVDTSYAAAYTFDPAAVIANDTDRRGALGEFLYQCAEGDFDKTPLFLSLKAIHDGIKPAPRPEPVAPAHVDRNEAIARIRAALKATGRTWSVTGGRGTAWGWLTVEAPPKRRDADGYTSAEDRSMLTVAFGLGPSMRNFVSVQGLSISPDDRAWYVAAVETHAPALDVC